MPYARDPHEFYKEPVWTVDALLREVSFSRGIYDPACGTGTVLISATSFGLRAEGSDIMDRGAAAKGLSVRTPVDFLKDAIGPTDNIVSNPPYSQAVPFIHRALSLAKFKVAMLLRLPFIASAKRAALFDGTPLAGIYVLTPRPSMPPGDMLAAGEIKAEGGKTDYAWFVWDHRRSGKPTINWLRRVA